MLTEAEARTKWCPFARVSASGFEAANRLTDNDRANGNTLIHAGMLCIASECMAWRKFGEHPEQKAKAEQEYRKSGRRLDVERIGYCGLAGRPE